MNKETQTAINNVEQPAGNFYFTCLKFAKEFIKTVDKFTSEDIKSAYELSNNPEPSEPRVWGAVIRELRRLKLIYHVDFERYKNPKGHSRPINVWRVL